MDQEHSLSWPGQLQEESLMNTPGDDEFTNFLEFGMHFPDLEGHGPGNHGRHPPSSLPSAVTLPPSTVADQTQMVRMDSDCAAQPSPYNRMMDNLPLDLHSQAQAQVHPSYSNAAMTPGFYAQEPPQHQSFQSHPQQPQCQSQPPSTYQPVPQQSTRQYVPQGQPMIPPTPNSMELHGNAARYPQRVDENHEMYDRYTRMNDEQALYTPLISPAMTPLENQFRLPEYTIPGEYFTPLTSPALEAQNSSSNGYPFHPAQQQVSEVGFLHSPVDNGIVGAPNSPGAIRKHRRRPSATSRFANRAKKQQSPSVRPQTRKKSLLNVNSDDLLNGLSQDQNGSKTRSSGGSSLRYGSNDSSQDSVSPEPLSEPLMPPPALPQARKSPAIGPQSSQAQAAGAATPAMLMRIQRSQHNQDPMGQFTGQARLVPGEPHDDIMEDVMLPEAVTPASQLSRPSITRIETAVPIDPTKSANATPSLEPRSAPVLERKPSSVAPSPRTLAMPSPSGPVGRKSDTPKLGPIARKRQSISQASPQLRPKISPNIQPMVRGEGVTGDTSALYLASKSNYQHILDGTLLPGVSYPETLAENLSSKRTNHKLAEQGRRNRINNALKEIEGLIPQSFVQVKNAKEAAAGIAKSNEKEKEKDKDKAANQVISKASTVEMAIDYIKALKRELEETKVKLAAAESQLNGKEGEANPSAVNKTGASDSMMEVTSTGSETKDSSA